MFAFLILSASVTLESVVPRFGALLPRIYPAGLTGNLARVVVERTDWTDTQRYDIASSPERIVVRTASDKGAAYAAARILRELGYRRFAPHPSWEILPENPPQNLTLNVSETPDYRMRKIWYLYNLWPEFRKNDDHESWTFFTRQGGDEIRCGHVYQTFVRREKEFFREHPECLALVDGERTGDKLCISNPLLRERFAQFVLREYESTRDIVAASVEPSDGGGWCTCEACQKLGSPSDRAITLANEAVAVLRRAHPGAKVAQYAYGLHSPPPSVKVDGDVIVLVATMFERDGWTASRLVDEWGRRTTIGIREYYYNNLGAPGRGWATDTRRMSETIPDFFRRGARYLTAESSDSWASGLLGLNVAAETMWNVRTNRKDVMRDFILRAFPSSPREMATFYGLIDGASAKPLTGDLLARMRDCLAAAYRKGSSAEKCRVAQLIGYACFCARLLAFELSGSDEDAVALFEAAAVLKPYYLVPTYWFYRDSRPLGASAKKIAADFDWRTVRPLDPEKGLAELAPYNRLAFEPREFGLDLVVDPQPAAKGAVELAPLRGNWSFYLQSDGKPFTLGVTGGLIPHYRNRGAVKVSLVQIGGASETGELETEVFHDESVPPDGERHDVLVRPRHPGLHRLDVSDGDDRTLYSFPDDLPVAVALMSDGLRQPLAGDFVFYVPKGTSQVGFFVRATAGRVCDPQGKVRLDLRRKTEYGLMDVPSGMDGRYWSVRGLRGVFRPLTVPSVLSINPRFPLKPKGVQ